MQQKSLSLGPDFADLELAYLDWGEQGASRTVVCVHGLTRNAHDFDVLAAALAARDCRVVAIDVAGRGCSGWLADPSRYEVPVYAAHLARFLDLLGLRGVDWIGTSMGGLIGMALAAGDAPPMTRLVVNDIGPFVADATLAQIRGYLGLDLVFKGMAELEAHLRLIHASFGQLTDAQWRRPGAAQQPGHARGPAPPLRPGDPRAVHRGGRGEYRPVAALGPHPLPDAGPARGRERALDR